MAQVLVVGSGNVDLVLRVPRLPRPGETVLGGGLMKALGGKGANQAVAVARLGGRVSFVGCLGDDAHGNELLGGLRDEGVDVSRVAVVPGEPTGVAVILVDDAAENVIAVAPGANMALDGATVERAVSTTREARVLLAQLEVPLPVVARAVEVAAARRMLTVLNPAPAPAEPLPATLLRHVTVLTPNRTELATLTGTAVPTVVEAEVAARRLLEQGVGAVVVSLGGDGALLVDARGARHHRAYPVEPVDPTGAGDAFNAGLAVALLEGKELDEAVRFANACGALATTRVGAQPSLPRRGDVEALLAAGQT